MGDSVPTGWKQVRFRDLLSESREPGGDGATANKLSVQLHGRGVRAKPNDRGGSARTAYFVRHANQLIYSKLDFINGAIGIVPDELDGFQSTADLPAFDVDSEVDLDWLKHYVTRRSFYRRYKSVARGSRRARRVAVEDFLASRLLLPPTAEQRQIAAYINTLDDIIVATSRVVEQLEVTKRALRIHLLSGGLSGPRVRRLDTPVGPIPETWSVCRFERLARPVRRPVQPDPDAEYVEIGIRSHGRGLFRKEPTTGAQIGAKRVFEVVPGSLMFNIVFAWEGAVAVPTHAEEGTIASHRFPMFRIHDELAVARYLYWYFTSNRGVYELGLASPGGAGRNRTLGQEALKKVLVPLPPKQEQQQIVAVLDATETRILQERHCLDHLKRVKAALAQALLTGRLRVPTGNAKRMARARGAGGR